MIKDWQELTKITGEQKIIIERVRIVDSDIVIEGQFDLPPLARLTGEDQVFLAAFVRSHGSIKQMESYFGVSYPTIKSRLNKLADKFEFVKIEPAPDKGDILERLDKGEITAEDAIELLKKGEYNE